MKKYKEYKDSGIAWIGEIPSEWEVKRLKNCFEFHKGGAWGEEATGNSNDYICVRVADFDYKSLCVNSEDYTIRNFTDAQVKKLQLVKGDLLIEKSGGGENSPVGRVVIFDKDFNALYANFIEAIRVAKNGCSNFYNYLFASLYSIGINRKFYSQTTGIQNLNVTDYLNEAYPIPPLQTQQAIADYLDRKTAGIDTLIADKQKLIDLLRKKRQATINEAVTKGLDKTVKMKDSGIEWIGEIPESWQVKKLNSICHKIGDVDHKMPESTDDGIPYISPKDFTKNEDIDFENAKKITKHSFDEIAKKIRPEKGDIIFARYATLGVVRIVNVDFDFLVSYSCAIIKQNEKLVNKKYLYYYLKSNCIEQEIYYYANANTQSNVGIDSIQRFKTITPPLPTQHVIADYLDRKTAQIDSLISDITDQIEKLKEYRQSIISEVVTGKVAV